VRGLSARDVALREDNNMKASRVAVLVAGFLAAFPALPGGDEVDRAWSDPLSPKERLGRQLFFDTSLSSPPGQSCATCHAPEQAFTDPDQRQPTSNGVNPNLFGSRNSPTAMYAAFSPAFHFDETEGLYVGGQFLDGRAATLEEQAKQPFLNPLEMANPDRRSVVESVRKAPYARLFKRVFGATSLDDVDQAYERIAEAIAAFERTRGFNRFTSKYDYYLAGKARLTAQELRGLEVYEDPARGNCAACHPSRPAEDGTPPLFTDFTYDNLGVPKNPYNPFYGMPATFNPDGRRFIDRGLGTAVNLRSEDGKFKVPTLRNIALSAPYMHNGYFLTLRGVVEFYSTRDTRPACRKDFTGEAEALQRGCWPAPEVAENVNQDELGRLGLTEQEIDDLVAFMNTLTDGYRPHPRQAYRP
jgi:cytochrome c peroxidase